MSPERSIWMELRVLVDLTATVALIASLMSRVLATIRLWVAISIALVIELCSTLKLSQLVSFDNNHLLMIFFFYRSVLEIAWMIVVAIVISTILSFVSTFSTLIGAPILMVPTIGRGSRWLMKPVASHGSCCSIHLWTCVCFALNLSLSMMLYLTF